VHVVVASSAPRVRVLSTRVGRGVGPVVKCVTRSRPKTYRIACPWFIRRFIDPDAEILYVPADQVLAIAEAEGGHGFDAAGAEYDHRGKKCTFEVMIDDFDRSEDTRLNSSHQII